MERSQEEFDRISRAIKKEMEQFDIVRVKDFKDMLVKYLEALMTSQQQVSKCVLFMSALFWGPNFFIYSSMLAVLPISYLFIFETCNLTEYFQIHVCGLIEHSHHFCK